MKSDDVRRSVRSKRYDRSAGDAPSMGRVSRMPGTGLPKGEKRRRKRGARPLRPQHFSVKLWSVLLAVLTLTTFGVVVIVGLLRTEKSASNSGASAQIPVSAKKNGMLLVPVPSEEDAVALVRKALAAQDDATFADCFRTTENQSENPLDQLQALNLRDGAVSQYEWLGSLNTKELPLECVVVHSGPNDNPKSRIAVLTPNAQGKWQVDFDAYARTTTPHWNEFLSGQAPSIHARIYVVEDTYYNGPFSDDAEWICFGIASPDMDQTLNAYCKRNSSQAAAMKRILAGEIRLQQAIVDLSVVDGALPRQFLLSRVFTGGWVMKPTALDADVDP